MSDFEYDDTEYEPYYDESTDGDPTPSDEAAHERAEYIRGLRMLADILESHPDTVLPVAGHSDGNPISWVTSWEADPKAATAAIVKAVGGRWDKKFSGAAGDLFVPETRIAGLYVQIIANRETVCTRRVVGTETVTKRVATAFEEQTVEQDVVEWDCGSLLAGAVQ